MLIVANWKAYVEDFARAKKLLALSKRLARTSGLTIALAPPAPFLGAFAAKRPAKGGRQHIEFAAQDVSGTTGGAVTGEVTAGALAAAGASYAIIGHSERRALGETASIVTEKLAHALAHGLIPILCIGERDRDGEGRYLATIREQITSAVQALTPKERARVIVAYEPVWAIGKTAADALDPNDLTEMVSYIRKVLAEHLPGKSATRAKVLYGGSVESANARDLARATGIDGFLVGHASVDPDSFTALLRQIS